MAYIFEEWTKMLEKFQQCVDKGVEEMHQQKAEVQQIKTDIFNRLDRGAYYRNDERIVISAPEIVIGNVDKSGALNGGETGTVIIKGSDVALEGVGDTGRIVSRAPSAACRRSCRRLATSCFTAAMPRTSSLRCLCMPVVAVSACMPTSGSISRRPSLPSGVKSRLKPPSKTWSLRARN